MERRAVNPGVGGSNPPAGAWVGGLISYPFLFLFVKWEAILGDSSVSFVVRSRGYSENMAVSLAKAINDFMSFVGRSSPGEALEYVKSLDLDQLVMLFRDYFVSSKDRLSPKTIWNWTNALRVWLYENGVPIDSVSKRITREFKRYIAPRGVPKILKRDFIEKEEVKRILLASDIRTRALIAVLASSGLRVGVSALRLQLKHFLDDIYKDQACYMLEIPESLTKGEENPHITFITREARDFLLAYLKKREARGERITPESYLFTAVDGGPLTYRGALHLWDRACRAAGIDRKPVELPGADEKRQRYRYNVRLHSLRKYFKTTCSLLGVDRVATEAMMGHSLSTFGIESVYDYCASNKEWLRQQYMKALPGLTFIAELPPGVQAVNGEARERIKTLEKEIEDLRGQLEKLWTFIQDVSKSLGGDFGITPEGRLLTGPQMKKELKKKRELILKEAYIPRDQIKKIRVLKKKNR